MSKNPLQRVFASTLVLVLMTTTAVAATHFVTYDPTAGTFSPKYLEIAKGDTVQWLGLGRRDAIVRIDVPSGVGNPSDVCFKPNASDPAYNNPYRRPFNPGVINEFTGPTRNGISGIWALGPEGDKSSGVEIPSAEADAIRPGITAADGCGALEQSKNDVELHEDPFSPSIVTGVLKYRYELDQFNSGLVLVKSNETDRSGAEHLLCTASTDRCNAGQDCRRISPDPAVPATIPPGSYFNGLLSSTYANPDITGVVLRFNWKDLQYDDAGTIIERWSHLDRELERAIAGGKLVTLDVRAGMFGTPDWIFADYLVAGSAHAAHWCSAPGCSFTSAPMGAGQVEAIEFVDYYDEEASGEGCGSPVRIGAPGNAHYRALYKNFIARLAAHIASDTRWFQAVAHIKVSGANLRTSEAELPHHCDDNYTNTADHQVDAKSSPTSDGVLDVFKTISGHLRKTASCVCNTKIWVDHGYRPQDLYDYYAEVEHQILASFFGRKSLGYQVLQDGFPRADALSGGFLGERLYGERLMNSSFLVNPSPPLPSTIVSVNEGYEARAVCNVPSINASGQPAVYENPGAPGPPVYCSTDTTNPPLTPRHLLLSIEPLRPSSMDPTRAYNGPTDEFPKAFEQSVTVLDEAGNGRFHDLTSITQINRVVGKLFVPQHSGLQPLSQERAALNYAPVASVKCRQQVGTRNLIIAPYYPEVGQYMADFPILESQAVSTDRAGCPNHWIVNQGKDQDSNPLFKFPPQLTGFQTTNKVRSIPHVESTLFNLTYNTNAVFIELYEDAIWRIAITKGTGPSALALAGPGSSIRTPGNPNNVCDPTLCYSKNLSQWAAELHVRRIEAAALWSKLQGISYPALEAPFPSTYQFTFQNTGVTAQVYSYINAGRCDPAAVDSGPLLNGKPSAMGVIKVLP